MQVLAPKRVGSIPINAGGGGTGTIDLPRDRFIQKIYGHLRIVGDTDASIAANEDNAARLVSSLRVVLNGDDTRISAPLIDLFHYSRQRSQNPGLVNSLIATVSQSGVVLGECDFVISFTAEQDERKNGLDLSALLPAHEASSLSIEVTFAGDDALGAAGDYTVTGGEIEISIKEFALTPAEVAQVIQPGRYWVYYLTGFTQNIAAASVNFDNQLDPPVGKVIRRIMLTSIRAGVRIDGALAGGVGLFEYEVVDSRRGDIPIVRQSWGGSTLQDRMEYGIDPPTGVTIIDFVELGNLDTRGYAKGQVNIKFNNAAPSGVTQLRVLNEQLAGAGSGR